MIFGETYEKNFKPRPFPRLVTAPVRHAPRILTALLGLALLGGIGLFASRPAHSVGGPVAVAVANTPLAVTLTDSPGQQPFISLTTYAIAAGGTFASLDTASSAADIQVPAGKRLIIQSVTAYRFNGTVTQNLKMFIQTSENSYPMPTIVPDGTAAPGVTLVETIPCKPGITLHFVGYRPGSVGAEKIIASVTGYLFDA